MQIRELDKEDRQVKHTWVSAWEVRMKLVTCIAIALPDGDIFASSIEKWEEAPDVAGCGIPL